MYKWKKDVLPTALFTTTHKDRTGGGELYAHQFAKSLDSITDLRYFTGNTGPLHPEFGKFHGKRHRFVATALMHPADIFVACSHFQIPAPIGKNRNVVLTFFPNPDHKELVKGYDTVVTCSTFSAYWVQKYWKKKAQVLWPYIDADDYSFGNEKDDLQICNVGRFFREPHGHSKKQHILIEAFARLVEKEPDANLILAGSVLSPSDSQYLDFCKTRARDLGVEGRVTFRPNIDFAGIRELYGRSRFFWHANGYGSETPYETEHFGIVIAEAMASGCTPIVFRDGGFRDFPARSWGDIDELVEETLKGPASNAEMRAYVLAHFSREKFDADVQNLFFKG